MGKMKALAETTESKAVAVPHDNPFLALAAEAGNELGTILKFVKGKWETGDDVVEEGTEFIAHVDQTVRGWVKFAGNKIADRVVGKVADGFKPASRETLGDTDPKAWPEKDTNGNPRDPWTEQWYLPLVGLEKGNLVTFITGSKGGKNAIGGLCGVFGRKSNGLLPIVALRTRSYKHPTYGRIETPSFDIVGWDDSNAPKEPKAFPVKGASDAEFDDTIPF